jgi:hypothetical protein
MKCKECKFWDIEAAKDKAGRVRKDKYALCLWVSQEIYPDSLSVYNRPRPSKHMGAEDGKTCPCFVKREK